MALAGIELRYIVDRLSEQIDGYYVNNVYGITRDSMLFKLRHTEKDDLFLMVSTFGIWPTSVKLGRIEENRLQRRLRSNLLRMRFKEIKQIGVERIVYLTFEGFGSEFVVVVELFGSGNVLLCSSRPEMKILALMHSVNMRHRTLDVGAAYAPPPLAPVSVRGSGSSSSSSPPAAVPAGSGPNLLDLSERDFAGLSQTEMAAAKWLGRTLNLPKKYVEGILHMAGIPPGTQGLLLGPGQVEAIFRTARRLVLDVVSGNHRPAIVRVEGARPEAVPVVMGPEDAYEGDGGGNRMSETPSFLAGLDEVFTESLLARARDAGASGSVGRIRDLQTQIEEQRRAIETVVERSDAVGGLARSLVGLAAQGVLSMSDGRIAPVLEEHKASLIREKGAHLVRIADKKIGIDMQASLQSVASSLFDEAKHQARAAPAIRRSMEAARQRLDKLQAQADSDRTRAGEEIATEIRKKSWFERYRWFWTSDGSLAVGGRDAASNSAVIRKRMDRDDRVFHAEVHGSPFFILKDAASPSDVSMSEVAHATVCFSRAWREGMHGLSAYWVHPDQVKRSAPTGQFLPKGSFTIGGRRNFIRAQALRLAVGVVRHNGGHVLVSGPPEPVAARSVMHAVIEPHGSDLAEAAKRLRAEFMRMDEEVTRKIPLDDFVRALPSGKSQIKSVEGATGVVEEEEEKVNG